MSFGDRLREAAQWIAAHPDETITVTISRDALTAALLGASEDLRWPTALDGWARELARKTAGMCMECWEASMPADWWDDSYVHPDNVQPTHADCARGACTCPCRTSRQDAP